LGHLEEGYVVRVTPNLRTQLQDTLVEAYAIEQELAGGGMSRVFVATDIHLGRKVVIKVLPPELAGEVRVSRFNREIQFAANLQHPHIVPVISAGDMNGLPFFVMPFVEGKSLRERLKEIGRFSADESIRILREVASALAFAHANGVVHRDIKPENVLISGDSAMVTDFGVAKAITDAAVSERSELTSAGIALGTPTYMAPEQASADPDTDYRADIYSLGVVGYEMLAGTPPFSARGRAAMLAAQVVDKPEDLAKRRSALPSLLSTLIMKCLEKNPSDRPQSAAEVVHQLDSLRSASEGISNNVTDLAGNISEGPATDNFQKRDDTSTRLRLILAAKILTGIVVLMGGAWLAARRHRFNENINAVTPSVAVLPFVNVGGAKENEYLGDGLAEELISGLSKVKNLKVAARTSSFAFRGRSDDVRKIAGKLGVASVLQGSIRRAGKRFRITVQLTSAQTGFNLWAETFDRDFTDIFRVQDEITAAIVSALQVSLAPKDTTAIRTTVTANVEAYDLYLKGLYNFNRRGQDGLREALVLYRRSIQHDPAYARAHAGLALAYVVSVSWSYLPAGAAMDSARFYAQKAIELDPESAEAYTALGQVLCSDFDFGGCERAIRQAMQLNPGYAFAPYALAWRISPFGRFDEAAALAKRARRLDPLNPQVFAALAKANYLARRYDEGLKLSAEFGTLRDASVIHGWRSHFLIAKGDGADAVEEAKLGLQLSDNSPVFLGIYANALLEAGQRDSAERVVYSLEKLRNRPSFAIAWYYARAGKSALTVAWLDTAYVEHSDWITMLALAEDFDPYRNNPKVSALLMKLGMSNVAAISRH
jgi:serine/threonine-protein kinase